MDLTPGMRALLPWWGTINAAVSQRLSTSDFYLYLRNAAAEQGLPLQGFSATDVSRLRGLAASQRTAGERFGRLRDDQTIGAESIASDISSRPEGAMAAAPQWLVRYQANILHDGEEQTMWVTNLFTGVLPPTKGDLRQQLHRDATRVIEDRNTTTLPVGAVLTGIGDVRIAAV